MDRSAPSHSHTFIVRVWREELGNGQAEWRGQVRHMLTGENVYFREWPALAAALETMLQREENRQEDPIKCSEL